MGTQLDKLIGSDTYDGFLWWIVNKRVGMIFLHFGRVKLGVITGMGVTDFTTFGPTAR